jgi:hypothetical protein
MVIATFTVKARYIQEKAAFEGVIARFRPIEFSSST